MSLLNSQFPLTVLTRVTIETDELLQQVMHEKLLPSFDTLTNNNQGTIQDLRNEFDLIAIKTTNVNLFQQACRDYDIDIISFYFNERMSFELNPIDIKKALERNIYFELCYANAIRGNDENDFTSPPPFVYMY